MENRKRAEFKREAVKTKNLLEKLVVWAGEGSGKS